MDSADIIYVGNDFADEYSGSQDTARLKGALDSVYGEKAGV